MTSEPDPAQYLSPCEVIDFHDPAIVEAATSLACGDCIETARRCFTFVRDRIRHSCDCQLNPVTCRASDVLRYGTGYCYAKSHLLAALLRANGIPAGLCYQRLMLGGRPPSFCLHGLSAIHLPSDGWYRVDARGNRDDIDARFDPPHERLAFAIKEPGECDLPGIHVRPLAVVVECLTRWDDWSDVASSLPDLPSDG